MVGVFPEFAVQILPAARVSRAVLESGRIANRIERQIIAGGQFRFGFQQFDELDDRVRAFRLVPMDARENADADRRVATIGPDEQIARKIVCFAVHVELHLVVGNEVRRMNGDLIQRREQVGHGPPGRQGRLGGAFGS